MNQELFLYVFILFKNSELTVLSNLVLIIVFTRAIKILYEDIICIT